MPIALIVLTLLALGLIVGLVRPERVARYLVRLALAPVVIALCIYWWQDAYAAAASWSDKLLMLGILPIGAVIALFLWLPRSVREHVVASAVYDILKWLVLAPFRLASGSLSRVPRRPPFLS